MKNQKEVTKKEVLYIERKVLNYFKETVGDTYKEEILQEKQKEMSSYEKYASLSKEEKEDFKLGV
jgi:hypothetical protein